MENLVMDQLFNDIYRGKKVLLTGHTGFKGSWLLYWLHALGAEVTGYALEPATHPSHYALLNMGSSEPHADIREVAMIKSVVDACKPEIIFHLAAQPLVRRSYADPLETFQTNIIGTVNLFEALRAQPSVKAIVNITTDKVYKNPETGLAFKETDTLGGHDPYSTSKACVELVHESYRNSFFKAIGIRSATARAGNVIGGGDWSEDRLIPDLIKAAAIDKITPVRNLGSIRPWQHVLDPLSGYLLLGQHLLQGDENADGAWNFGPDDEDAFNVQQVLEKFERCWDKVRWQNVSNAETPHESGTLRLNCIKAAVELSWKPVWNIEKSIKKTADWYKSFYSSGKVNTGEDLDQYIADARNKSASWVN